MFRLMMMMMMTPFIYFFVQWGYFMRHTDIGGSRFIEPLYTSTILLLWQWGARVNNCPALITRASISWVSARGRSSQSFVDHSRCVGRHLTVTTIIYSARRRRAVSADRGGAGGGPGGLRRWRRRQPHGGLSPGERLSTATSSSASDES